MGNQPSLPMPQAPISANVVPPPPPPCDLECQKQKQLVLLKQSMDAAQGTDGYEKARIAYYTLLNGPGWLAQEKHRIASEEVEPVLKSYQQQYNALKGEQQSQSIFKNLADGLKVQLAADEQSNAYLDKQLMIEKDKAQTAERMSELGSSSSYISWVIDIVIAILGLFVLYKAYTRFFGQVSMSPAVPDLTST